MPESGHHLSANDVADADTAPLVYAIGDIHDSLQKLRDLMTQCRRYADGRPATFVFLGDYIDRGPDSRGVIETLMDLQSRQPDRVVALNYGRVLAMGSPAEVQVHPDVVAAYLGT